MLSKSLPPGELSLCNPSLHLSFNSNRLPWGHEGWENAYFLSNCLIICDLWSALGQYVVQRNAQCTWNFWYCKMNDSVLFTCIKRAIQKSECMYRTTSWKWLVMKSISAPLSGWWSCSTYPVLWCCYCSRQRAIQIRKLQFSQNGSDDTSNVHGYCGTINVAAQSS